jgi:hypothetical protein
VEKQNVKHGGWSINKDNRSRFTRNIVIVAIISVIIGSIIGFSFGSNSSSSKTNSHYNITKYQPPVNSTSISTIISTTSTTSSTTSTSTFTTTIIWNYNYTSKSGYTYGSNYYYGVTNVSTKLNGNYSTYICNAAGYILSDVSWVPTYGIGGISSIGTQNNDTCEASTKNLTNQLWFMETAGKAGGEVTLTEIGTTLPNYKSFSGENIVNFNTSNNSDFVVITGAIKLNSTYKNMLTWSYYVNPDFLYYCNNTTPNQWTDGILENSTTVSREDYTTFALFCTGIPKGNYSFWLNDSNIQSSALVAYVFNTN